MRQGANAKLKLKSTTLEAFCFRRSFFIFTKINLPFPRLTLAVGLLGLSLGSVKLLNLK